MNLIAMLSAVPMGRGTAVTKTRPPRTNSPIRKRSDEAYQHLLSGQALTTGEVAAKRGLTHMGCLCSLRKMEARGVVMRVGTRPKQGVGKAPIIWTWREDAPMKELP